jgi:hypothetical protein
MAGPWQIDLSIVAPGQIASTVQLDLDVSP